MRLGIRLTGRHTDGSRDGHEQVNDAYENDAAPPGNGEPAGAELTGAGSAGTGFSDTALADQGSAAGVEADAPTGAAPAAPPGAGPRTGGRRRTLGRRWPRWLVPLGEGISAWWRGTDLAGRAFALVTALPALLLAAWLVPGIALLLGGRFLPVPMLLIAAPVAVALVMLCARNIPGRWPRPGRRGTTGSVRQRDAWWGLGGTVAVAAGFAAWQLAVNSPQLIVTRDPGAYLQFGYWIAQHGSLPIPVSLAAFGGIHPGLTFSSFGFAGHGTALAPQFMAGLPITLSAGLWAHGIPGAAVMSPVLGGLAVLTVGGLTGRLAGPQWAPLGALLLALTVPEIYTSRSAFTETLVQALLFGGLCLVVDSMFTRRPVILAATGGAVLGLTTLAWAGSALALLPMIIFGGVLLAGRRPQGIPFAAGLAAATALGLVSGFALAMPSLITTSPSLRITGFVAAGFLVATVAGVAVALLGPARRRAARLLAARPLRWLPEAGAAAVVIVTVLFAVRPYLQTVRGPANPYVGALQRLLGLPVDPGRLYAEKSLYWVVWYLGVPALLLGVAGLAVLTRRCLRALLRWQDRTGKARALALPVAVTGWGFLAVLWRPPTVPDQPWASRTLVPVVLPGLVVLAVWVAAWLTDRAQRSGAGAVAVGTATACFAAALALPIAAITFEIGPWHVATPSVRVALNGLAFRRTGTDQYAADLALCGSFGPRSSVVLLDQPAAREFGQVIRGLCGVPAGIAAGASKADVQAVIGGIERAGRHPVLLATEPSELTAYQARPVRVMNLATEQDAHVLTQPPTATWPAGYVLWRGTPALAFGG